MNPRGYIDALDDFALKPLAQIVRVHGVQLPTAAAIIPVEPGIARVAALRFNAERWQRIGAMGAGQSDARDVDNAAIFFDAARQIDLGHMHPLRVKVADVENFEIAIADKRLFRNIMKRRR